MRDGRLDEVTLTDADGKAVPGEFNAERTSWSSTERLDYAGRYTWGGKATGTDGQQVPLAGTFGTVTPKKTVRGTLNIGDDRTVGVAAPIRIQFNGHVSDRAAVERALSVTTSVPVDGGLGLAAGRGRRLPGGLPDQGVLAGQHHGDGRRPSCSASPTATARTGPRTSRPRFTIGRSQIVKADVNSFRMVVMRDGKKVADYPASYGLGSDPDRNTRSGVHVVSEKFTDKRMVSERYDYDLVEKWAVRISNNGEFIHANPDSTAAQGSSNVTHGCVNLAHPTTPRPTTTPRSTATRSRSPAPRSSCPPGTATSGTGP